MFEYQKHHKFFAQIAGSMEEIGATELKEFGAKKINTVYRGIHFETDLSHIYRINLQGRVISRILAPLLTFDCHSTKYLYNSAVKIEWDKILDLKKTFAIYANVANSKIKHSKYASLILKDAIADYFKDKYGERPNIDTENPDVVFNLFVHQNRATISLDTSGQPLHKRGYRTSKGSAPMIETLAATIIRLSGWNGKTPLYDPMCGSGTLLCEALMHYCRIPANHKRAKFGFENLPDFDETEWLKVKENSNRNLRELPKNLLFGSDVSFHAIKDAIANASTLPSGNLANFQQSNFKNLPEIHNAIIVCNPPYGIRLGDEESVTKLYKEFGDFLKQRCKNSTAYIYVGDRTLIPAIGLKPSRKIPLKNGNLDGRLLKIDIY